MCTVRVTVCFNFYRFPHRQSTRTYHLFRLDLSMEMSTHVIAKIQGLIDQIDSQLKPIRPQETSNASNQQKIVCADVQ